MLRAVRGEVVYHHQGFTLIDDGLAIRFLEHVLKTWQVYISGGVGRIDDAGSVVQ